MINLLARDTWHRAEDIAVIDRGDRVVILNLDRLSSPPVALEGSAADLWRLIDGDCSEASLVVAVARAFGVRPAEVRSDVHEFLRHLHELGLIARGAAR